MHGQIPAGSTWVWIVRRGLQQLTMLQLAVLTQADSAIIQSWQKLVLQLKTDDCFLARLGQESN